MVKPKTRSELKKAKEAFYNEAVSDPQLNVFNRKLSELSVTDPKYNELLNELFLYLDEKFKRYIGYEVQSGTDSGTS